MVALTDDWLAPMLAALKAVTKVVLWDSWRVAMSADSKVELRAETKADLRAGELVEKTVVQRAAQRAVQMVVLMACSKAELRVA